MLAIAELNLMTRVLSWFHPSAIHRAPTARRHGIHTDIEDESPSDDPWSTTTDKADFRVSDGFFFWRCGLIVMDDGPDKWNDVLMLMPGNLEVSNHCMVPELSRLWNCGETLW